MVATAAQENLNPKLESHQNESAFATVVSGQNTEDKGLQAGGFHSNEGMPSNGSKTFTNDLRKCNQNSANTLSDDKQTK